MSYLVLARKYRPQTFADIIGQEHITKAICNALVRDRVPHALLFTGSRGVGKTSSARVIAKALNCSGRVVPSYEEVKTNPDLLNTLEPCGSCSNCTEITRGVSLSVFEMDGASNNSVDDVRQLIDTLYTAPPPGIAYKIYIIDEVHMLSTAAFNALLKSLEEPPQNTVFIFATTEPHKIPDTVLSRCQQHDFRRISVSTIVSQLRKIADKEGFDIQESVLNLIARRADGGMRDATTLLDRVSASSVGEITFESAGSILGAFDVSHYASIVKNILNEDCSSALESIAKAFSSSVDVRSYVSDFISYCRMISLYALALRRGEKASTSFVHFEEISDVELEAIKSIVEVYPVELLTELFDQVRQIGDVAIKSEYPRYVLEAGIVKLSNLPKLLPVADILARISSLKISAPQTDAKVLSAVSHNKTGASLSDSDHSAHEKVLHEAGLQDKKKSSIANDNPELVESKPIVTQSTNLSTFGDSNTSNSSLKYVWDDFISYLRSYKDLRLDTYIRRVGPKEFYSVPSLNKGFLSLLASQFEQDALKDSETMSLLKQRLQGFSTLENWEVSFITHNPQASKQQAEQNFKQQNRKTSDSLTQKAVKPVSHAASIQGSANIQSSGSAQNTANNQNGNSRTPQVASDEVKKNDSSNRMSKYIPGSYDAKTEERRLKQFEKLKEEAVNDDFVKTVLEIFGGSSVEKVVPLKKKSQEAAS